ncbi:MAG TPA: hypothetical protein EYQ31_04970 [Candidatus Handelsmanbacteria bacterium]|nr:hypothetical protein [Candidatus Handelsmanbacteria bacterium]
MFDFDHRAQVVQLGGTTEVVEGVEIVSAVFGNKFDVIVHPGVREGLDDIRPRGVHVGADGRLSNVEELTNFIRSNGVCYLRSWWTIRTGI